MSPARQPAVSAALTGLVVLLLAMVASPRASAQARASFTQVQNDVMCIACHEPLAVAQSPEAFSERQYIHQLIAQGLTTAQIERELVAQYGPSVLAKPPARGFNLLIYVLPPALLAIGVATLVYTLPKWRRRSRQAGADPMSRPPPLDPGDARRLEEELGRQI